MAIQAQNRLRDKKTFFFLTFPSMIRKQVNISKKTKYKTYHLSACFRCKFHSRALRQP